MTPVEYISIPSIIYKLPIRGLYELSIFALIYNFNGNGLRLSNGKLAQIMSCDKRSIERVISKLKKQGYIRDTGTSKNDRCLVINTDKVTVSDTDIMTAEIPTLRGANTDKTTDHKEKDNNNIIYTDFSFVLRTQKHWNLPQEKLNEYKQTYNSGLDVEAELRKASQWLLDNPAKRKTAKGMPRFLNGWLGRTKPAHSQGTTGSKNQFWDMKAEKGYFEDFIERNAPTEEQAEKIMQETRL